MMLVLMLMTSLYDLRSLDGLLGSHICKVAPGSSTIALLSMVLSELNGSDVYLRHLTEFFPIDL